MSLRLAVVGKGGAGKSVIAGTLARLLARSGRDVLVLDSDTVPGVALSLGARPPGVPPLMAAAERGEDGRWRYVRGVGPVAAIRRHATAAPDGVRLLQIGKTTAEGVAPVMAATQAFYRTIHGFDRAATFRDWDVIGDLPAGARQVAFDWAPYATRFLLVVEPTWQSMLTARRIASVARRARPEAALAVVVSKAAGPADSTRIGSFLDLDVLAVVPADEHVRAAERAGEALLDHAPSAPATRAVARLADALRGSSLG